MAYAAESYIRGASSERWWLTFVKTETPDNAQHGIQPESQEGGGQAKENGKDDY